MMINKLIVVLIVAVSLPAFAESAKFEQGVHYEVIDDQPKDKSLGVIEFYSFYCVHCYRFESVATALKQSFNDQFRKIHLSSMGPSKNAGPMMTRGYILAKNLDVETEVSAAVFSQNFELREMVTAPEDLKAIFKQHGVSEKDYDRGMQSFSIRAEEMQWQKLAQRLDVRATPTFIVNGKYKLDPTSFRESDDFTQSMIDLTRYLLAK